MRPGQTAPECSFDLNNYFTYGSGFNEAGADCPGMRTGRFSQMRPRKRFNEAGADCPGMHPEAAEQ